MHSGHWKRITVIFNLPSFITTSTMRDVKIYIEFLEKKQQEAREQYWRLSKCLIYFITEMQIFSPKVNLDYKVPTFTGLCKWILWAHNCWKNGLVCWRVPEVGWKHDHASQGKQIEAGQSRCRGLRGSVGVQHLCLIHLASRHIFFKIQNTAET